MSDFDPVLAVKRAAMLAVTKKTAEFNLREIQRWYSETFCTELERVEELPVETISLHYFEVLYQAMGPEEREQEMRLLVETEDQRLDRLRKDEEAADDDEAFHRAIEQAEALKEAAANALKSVGTAIAGAASSIQVPIPVGTEPSLPAIKSIPEGIDMQFVSEEDMADMSEWDLMGPPKKH